LFSRQKAQEKTIKNMAATISDMNNTIKQLTIQQRPSNEPTSVPSNQPECSILIAGGHDGESYLCSTEIFDFATKTWTTVGPMKHSRLAPSVFLYQNNVIVAGGFNGDTSTDRMEGMTCRISFFKVKTQKYYLFMG
jgi:hypothetical protein